MLDYLGDVRVIVRIVYSIHITYLHIVRGDEHESFIGLLIQNE